MKILRSLEMEAAKKIIPVKHLRTMRKILAAGRPPPVYSLEELHVAINETDVVDFTRSKDGHRLKSIYCPARRSVLVTTTRQLNILREARQLHADATYKIMPTGLGRQLFTMHANWGGHVSVFLLLLSPFSQRSVNNVLGIFHRVKICPCPKHSFHHNRLAWWRALSWSQLIT